MQTTLDILSQSVIAVTQQLGQGVSNFQIVDVNCDSSARAEACIACVDFWTKQGELNDKEIISACQFACVCLVDDLYLKSNVIVDFSTMVTAVTAHEFEDVFIQNLYLEADAQGKSMYGKDLEDVRSIANSIFTKMQSDTVQKSFQQLSSVQSVTLRGPGTITAVSITSMANAISSVILSSDTLVVDVNRLNQALRVTLQQIVEAGLSQVFVIIAQIVVLLVLFTLSGFIINLFFSFYALQVTG